MKFIQILNRHTRKITAIWGGVFLFELVSPMVGMALTAGPTAPEATSFEPIDTTDMVNPLTGSLTYNLPLLEVPGPEGGYPLSLSYHAGIRPDVEASWVGLGWTLNPGAINRNVAGLPDDFNEVSLKRRDYWSGGSRKEFGLSVGFASTVNVGLVFSSDTYQGFGVGASVGYGFNMGPISTGIDVGIGPYGGVYTGVSVSTGRAVAKGIGLSTGLSISTNFESVSVGGGVSLAKSNGGDKVSTSLLSASMSSSSNKPSLSIMGSTGSVMNKNAGRISTSSSGFGLTIPLGVISVGLSFKNTRYWSDETSQVYSSGSLYAPIFSENTDFSYWDNSNYDNYRLLPDNINIADNPEDFQMLGGTLPEYDNYSISGQGIGGQIRPFLYQRSLHLQNSQSGASFSKATATNSFIKQGVGFRFVNDFSNSFDQGMDDVAMQLGVLRGRTILPFGMGENIDNRIGNEVIASKHIKYFTNAEISSGTAKSKGFIDVGATAKGFQRLVNGGVIGHNTPVSKGASQIGGFMVTNESGVTYHYALPVYSYSEYSYNYVNNATEGFKFSATTRDEPYAYTWLLTAVTGPDYVDRNGNGLVDAADWGYWTAMDYGKWTENYLWRTPAEGKDHDLDQNYQMYSFGYKQLYYLNKIRTRTHTAIFEKDVRLDGKGTGANFFGKDEYNNGGFSSLSAQSLKLSRIYLLNNSDANLVNEQSSGDIKYSYNGLFTNVLDFGDVNEIGRSLLESKAIRVIDFGHDYSLVKNTPNSFKIDQPIVKYGKLTLKGIQFKGKGGVNLLPQTVFSYDEPNNSMFGATVFANNQFTTVSAISMEVGTMVENAEDSSIYYGMITAVTNGGQGKVYTVANGTGFGENPIALKLRRTKNPEYCKDCQDVWGYYKGDIDKALLGLNNDLAKRVTATSAQGTDAWNLRSISSPTGSSIELKYESNEFKKAVFERNVSIPIRAFRRLDDRRFAVDLPLDVKIFEEKYTVGGVISGFFVGKLSSFPIAPIYSNSGSPTCYYEGRNGSATNSIIIRFTSDVPLMYAGNIRLPLDPLINYGGGVRIKTVGIKTVDNTNYQTEYQYRVNNSSTGLTSYLPYNIETGDFTGISSEIYKTMYKKLLNKEVQDILKYAREIPGPGVMYESVRIQNRVVLPNGDSQKEGYTENRYRVMDERMIKRVILQDQDGGDHNTHAVNLRISDFTTNIGDLKGIKYFDADGKLIKETKNEYLYDQTEIAVPSNDIRDYYKAELKNKFNLQGFINERFAEARYNTAKDGSNVIMTAREQYPSILLSSTVTDYVNNSSETTKNLGFDFLNGQPDSVLKKDSYGNYFMTETGFAYKQYPEMRSKLISLNNKNMLSQVYSQVNYKVDANNNKLGVISASRTIWGKGADVLDPDGVIIKQNIATNGNIWRKQRKEIFEIPDQYGVSGVLPISQFSFSSGYWKLVSAYSLYNVYSKALEDYDRNNNYSANRYGYNNSKIVAGANFAKYREIAFSGAEDELLGKTVSGEVTKGGGTVSSSAAHTGSKSLSVPANAIGFEYTVPVSGLTIGRTYVASVWVKNVANSNFGLYYNIGGADIAAPITSATSTKKSGNWILVNLEIKVTGGTTLKVFTKNTGTAAGFVDDFRFHPKNSSSIAYVYDAFSGELTYILDHLNLYTKFEYDAIGRLTKTYKEQFGRTPYKTNEYQMNYASKSGDQMYYNDEISGIYRKNDCGYQLEGSTHSYQIAAGAFSSKFSKADADEKAKAELDRLGQRNANTIGICSACKTYKFTVGLDPETMWIRYKNCGVNAYSIMPLKYLGSNVGGKRVFTLCTEEDPYTVAFGYSQNGEFYTGWSAVTFESLGACIQ